MMLNIPKPKFYFAVPVGGVKSLPKQEQILWWLRTTRSLMEMAQGCGFGPDDPWFLDNMASVDEMFGAGRDA